MPSSGGVCGGVVGTVVKDNGGVSLLDLTSTSTVSFLSDAISYVLVSGMFMVRQRKEAIVVKL